MGVILNRCIAVIGKTPVILSCPQMNLVIGQTVARNTLVPNLHQLQNLCASADNDRILRWSRRVRPWSIVG